MQNAKQIKRYRTRILFGIAALLFFVRIVHPSQIQVAFFKVFDPFLTQAENWLQSDQGASVKADVETTGFGQEVRFEITNTRSKPIRGVTANVRVLDQHGNIIKYFHWTPIFGWDQNRKGLLINPGQKWKTPKGSGILLKSSQAASVEVAIRSTHPRTNPKRNSPIEPKHMTVMAK